MGSRLHITQSHSRNGSMNGIIATYSPLNEETNPMLSHASSDSEECFVDLNDAADVLVKLDDSSNFRDSKKAQSDLYLPRENTDTLIKVSSCESKLISHSRQSSGSSSSGDFRSSSKQYPDEKFKTLMSFGFLFLGLFSTTVALATVHDRLPNSPPLPDVIFSVFPQWDLGLAISEYLLMLCIYPVFALIFFHRHRWIIARRIFVMVGLLYMGRAVTMLVTSIPVANTNYYCAPKDNVTHPFKILSRAWTLMTGFGMSINGKHFYCGDYIYSGHTCMLVLSAMIYGEYLPRKGWRSRAVRAFFYVCSALGVILVSISRGHYTVDIVIAYAVTTMIFWIYHTIISFPILKTAQSPNNHLSQIWWYRILIYFEKNVPEGKIPVRFNWPLPWPKRFVGWKLDFLE